jgi:GR25 family glycosyltransferase involved in LPS biosynthesis
MIPIIVLNLERSTLRKELMIEQFEKLHLIENQDFFFLPAYDGVNITNFSFNANISIGYGAGRKFQKAEIAIIMSQIGAIKFAQMMKFESVIILEDDVVLCEDWVERIDSLKRTLPSNWDHVYLSGHSDYVKFKVHTEPTLIEAPKMVGAFAYMLSNKAYSRVTRFTSSMLTTFDDMIMYMIDQGKLKSYAYFPFMAFHNANESNIWESDPAKYVKNSGDVHSSFNYFKNKL